MDFEACKSLNTKGENSCIYDHSSNDKTFILKQEMK